MFDLLNPYALLGGLTTLTPFVAHGAIFLALKTGGTIRVRANRMAREGWAILGSAVTLGTAVLGLLGTLFPNVLPNVDRALPGLTVENASASELTLQIMFVVPLILTPVVLAYQGWTYWVLRRRLSADDIPNGHQESLDYPHEAALAERG